MAPPVTVAPAPIKAGFNQTWNSVVDILSEKNIPVKTLDKSSGYVMAEITGVSVGSEKGFADCGHTTMASLLLGGGEIGTVIARYNILVRGDSAASQVKVTATFVMDNKGHQTTCSSLGTFESQFQGDVKARAETTIR
jgi:uncharacterized lipoprotein